MPFFLQLVVDRVLVGRDRDLLTVLGVAFGALVVITVAVTAVRAWVSVYLCTNLNLRLLSTLFAHLVKLPLALVREAQHRRHRLQVPQRGRDPEDADDHLRRDGGGRPDGGADPDRDGLVQRDADRRGDRRRPPLRRAALDPLLPAALRHRRAALPRGEERHALHRDAARDDGHQAQPARERAALGLPEPGGGPDQRRREGAERGHRAARGQRPHLRPGERGVIWLGALAGDGRQVLRGACSTPSSASSWCS